MARPRYRYQKTPWGNGQQDIPRTWNEETGTEDGKDAWGKRKGELKPQPRPKDGYVQRRFKERKLV